MATPERGHQQDRHARELEAQHRQQVEAIQTRHSVVEDDEVERALAERLQDLGAAVPLGDMVPLELEASAQHAPHLVVVIDDENPEGRKRPCVRFTHSRARRSQWGDKRATHAL